MNNKLFVRIVIAVVIVGALGFALYRQFHSNPYDLNSGTLVTLDPSATPVPLTYGTPDADWVQYASASLGFKLRIPKDWVASSCGAKCVGWAMSSDPQKLVTGVIIMPGKLQDILTESAPYAVASSSVKINSITWEKVTLQQPATGDLFTTHLTQRGSNVYEFGITAQEPALLDVYGKMLTSFTFTR